MISPVFMFGFERSGTTLLSMMMGAHPQLAVPLSVTALWFGYNDRLQKYNLLQSRSDLENLVNDLLKEERIRLLDEDFSAEEVLARISDLSFASVVRSFHENYASKKSKRHWANLDIATLDEMHVVHAWFPDARYIHIVRDGRDVALSHETMPYGAANTMDCAIAWSQRLSTNIKMGKMLGADRYRVVRYEDLVLDSESTLRGLCDFIGIEYDESMLKYDEMVSEKIPEDRRWLWPALDQAPQSSKCYRWKSKMDKRRRIVFEGEAGPMLKTLGYEAYDNVPKSLAAYCFEFWCFLGRGGRLRRVRKRLGLARSSTLEQQWEKSGQ